MSRNKLCFHRGYAYVTHKKKTQTMNQKMLTIIIEKCEEL